MFVGEMSVCVRGEASKGENGGEGGRTPHSEDLPCMTLKYIPENSGQRGNRSQKYESTQIVRATKIDLNVH